MPFVARTDNSMDKTATERAADILLVSSNHAEVTQLQTAIRRAKVQNRLHHVGDAIEAQAYLHREGPYENAPLPGLVLLDTALPKLSVVNLIASVKGDNGLSQVAIIGLVDDGFEPVELDDYVLALDDTIEKPFTLRKLGEALCHIDGLSFLLTRTME